LQKYPELNQYLSRNGDLLEISDEGWDAVLAKQEQAVQLAMSGTLESQANLAQLQVRQQTKEYYDANSHEYQSENVMSSLSGVNPMSLLGPEFGAVNAATGALTKQLYKATDEWGAFGRIVEGVTASSANGLAMLGPLGTLASIGIASASHNAEEERRTQTTDFAKAITEKGLSFDVDEAAIKSIYADIFGKEMTDDIYEQMASTSDGLRSLGNAAIQAQEKMNLFADQLISAANTSANVSAEWSNSVTFLQQQELNGENIDAQIDAQIKALKSSMTNKEALAAYAEAAGYGYNNGKIYRSKNVAE
jgi:hypothetical protein